jgi:hypothetical protein
MHAACAEGKNGRGKRERRHRGVAPLLYRCGGGQVDGVAHAVGEGRGGFGGGCPTPTDAPVDSGPRPAGAGGWCGVVMPHGRRETGERRGLTGGPLLQSRGLNPSSVNRSTLYEFEFQLVRTSTNPNLTFLSSKNLNKIWF